MNKKACAGREQEQGQGQGQGQGRERERERGEREERERVLLDTVSCDTGGRGALAKAATEMISPNLRAGEIALVRMNRQGGLEVLQARPGGLRLSMLLNLLRGIYWLRRQVRHPGRERTALLSSSAG